MSIVPASSAAEGLLFPAFMYGDKTTCRRKMKAEAKKWAQCYLAGRGFPEPKLLPVAPGSTVFTHESTANVVGGGYSFSPTANIVTISSNPKERGLHIQWRLYLLEKLQFEAEIAANLSRVECFPFRVKFVSFVCKYSWGAVAMSTCRALFNAIELTVPRIEGVLRHWEALDALKYVDIFPHPVSLAKLMFFHFRGAVAMWVDQPTGNIRADLQSAIDQMHHASEEEIHFRLVKRLREFARTEEDVTHREVLSLPGVVEAGLEAERHIGQEWYDDLTTGQISSHCRFLSDLSKKHAESLH